MSLSHSLLRPIWFAVPCLVVAVSCGGGQPTPESPPPEAPPAPAEPPQEATAPAEEPAAPGAEAEVQIPPDMAFDDMSEVQQKAFMQKVVLPRMTEVFQTFDKEHFKEVTCVTCHGERAKQGDFHMPNADLPKLNPAKQFAEHKKKSAKMLEFMMTKVTPEMVTLLKKQPFDPKTQQGFGCFACHTMPK
jgi:hypothetical protein